jgi:hypothetical protein
MKPIGKIVPLLLLAFATLRAPKTVQAQVETAPLTRHFGAVAFAFNETGRVNIAQYSDPNEFPPGTTCKFGIEFLGAKGSPLVPEFNGQVAPGQIVFADVNRNKLPSTIDGVAVNRVPFRVVVGFISAPNQIPNPCTDIRVTVEIYDNLTGRTWVFVQPGCFLNAVGEEIGC